MTEPIGATSPLTFSPDQYANALTPDALMVYLSTRLEGLDEQIQGIFTRQQTADEIRSAINDLKSALRTLDENSDKNKELEGSPETFEDIATALDEIEALDPKLGARLRQDLSRDGYILADPDAAAPEPSIDDVADAVAEMMLHQRHQQALHVDLPEGMDVDAPEQEPITYTTAAIENTSKYLDDLSSELESASQMNMIRLQSLMSNRQTAVSLSTNLIAKLSESLEGVVNNIR